MREHTSKRKRNRNRNKNRNRHKNHKQNGVQNGNGNGNKKCRKRERIDMDLTTQTQKLSQSLSQPLQSQSKSPTTHRTIPNTRKTRARHILTTNKDELSGTEYLEFTAIIKDLHRMRGSKDTQQFEKVINVFNCLKHRNDTNLQKLKQFQSIIHVLFNSNMSKIEETE